MTKRINGELFTAKLISFFANPIVTLLGAFVWGSYSQIASAPEVFIMFIFLAGFFPAILYAHYLYLHKRHWLDYAALPQDKRNNIFLTTLISFCLVMVLFVYTGQPVFWEYTAMLFVIFFAAFYLVNRFIDKASLHTGGFAFAIFYLTNRVSIAFAILLVLLPFISWSRMKLHKHTWFQLMLGLVLGMFLGLLSWTF